MHVNKTICHSETVKKLTLYFYPTSAFPGSGSRTQDDRERRWYNVQQKSKPRIACYKIKQQQTGKFYASLCVTPFTLYWQNNIFNTIIRYNVTFIGRGAPTITLTVIDELVFDIIGRSSHGPDEAPEPFSSDTAVDVLGTAQQQQQQQSSSAEILTALYVCAINFYIPIKTIY